MAGMVRAMDATSTGAQKLLGKIEIFISSFLNFYFAPSQPLTAVLHQHSASL